MRVRSAILCNLLVPGSGLIILRREWLGVSTALLFTILAQGALLGALVLPAAVPVWLTTACFAGALLVWLGAQWRLWVWTRTATGPAVEYEVAELCRRAGEAAVRREYAEAAHILEVARTLDDENVTVNLQWAELTTLMGRFGQARRAWRRVLQLDRSGEHRRRADEALASLPRG